MGSEHYCLRWNNHQSNLLGVFSQLLRDESLVDVTLACSEGHSIRAHKVVLSACSSYFQTLFVDHPSRHPIVILKDVRFSELRTLVEFMYKGEVNVEYCQLSALLKTAESLKVKGLAEMTNLNSSSANDDDRPLQQPPPISSQPPPSQQPLPAQTTPVQLTTTNNNTTTTSSADLMDTDPEQTEPTELVNKRLKDDNSSSTLGGTESPPPAPLSLRRRSNSQPKPEQPSRPHSTESIRPDSPDSDHNSTTPHNSSCGPSDMSMNSSNANNNNNTINTNNNNSTVTTPGGLLGTAPSVCNRLSSPHSTEPVPGPSGMPPIQQVPLSLKKEVDWSSTSFGEEKGECSSEYRHHESDLLSGVVGNLASIGGESLCLEQGGGSPRLYPCMYCGASFPHQSKLTRHILSHSLESLKYREMQHHPLALGTAAGLSEAPLHLIEQHFAASGVGGGGSGRPPPAPHEVSSVDTPSEAHALALSLPSPMDLELAAGEVAAGVGASAGGVVLCKFCGKSFPDVGSLIGHLPAHTGDRPFKCEFCGKAFKLRHHMKDHCRVHTGERPFRCALCGKTFSRSTILKAHEKTHYPKYVRKFLSPSPLDTEEESPH